MIKSTLFIKALPALLVCGAFISGAFAQPSPSRPPDGTPDPSSLDPNGGTPDPSTLDPDGGTPNPDNLPQPNGGSGNPGSFLDDVKTVLDQGNERIGSGLFFSRLLNSGWNSSDDNAALSLIRELKLRPTILTGTDGGGNLLGLEYNFDKSIKNKTLNSEGNNPAGLSFNLFARGTLTESPEKNPNSFLESGIDLHLFQSIGGMTSRVITDRATLELRQSIQQQRAEGKISREKAAEIMLADARPQLSYSVTANASLESDQTFAEKQLVYGGRVSLTYMDVTDDSPLNWLNVFDIPFAALRSFWDSEKSLSLRPSGLDFPVLIGGIDFVDPTSNALRRAVDPTLDSYPRFRAEIAFKTEAITIFDTTLWFTASYRYFKEISPSAAISAAGMDEYQYFVAQLDLPKGFNVSYSNGELPLDQNSDQIFGIGWNLDF